MTELRVSLCLLTLSGLLVLAIRRAARPEAGGGTRALLLDWCFFGLFAVALLTWRAPFLSFDRELNPDESQMLAQVMKYEENLIPWHSVDGTTSGPLNTYVLMWPLLAGIRPTYLTARLTGAACIFLTVIFCARTFGQVAGKRYALLGVGPLSFCYLLASAADLVHYSSEHLPVCLLSAALWLITISLEKPTARKLFLFGVCLGAIPFTKLQAGPLALYLFLGFCCALVFVGLRPAKPGPAIYSLSASLRSIGLVSFGALLIPLMILLAVAFAGAFDEFLSRYILSGAIYRSGTPVPAIRLLARFFAIDSLHDYFLGLAAGCSLTLAFMVPSLRRAPASWIAGFLFALGYLLCSMFIVTWSGFQFLHYALFLVTPATYLTAWICRGVSLPLSEISQPPAYPWLNALKPLAAPVFCVVIQLVGFGAAGRQHAPFATPVRNEDREAAIIKAISAQAGSRRESMAVWGWTPSYYVRTGLRPATRDSIGQYLLLDHPETDHYREVFLQDLRKEMPRLFVDSADEFTWDQWGPATHRRHTMYPPLAEFLNGHYHLAAALVTHPGGLPVLVYVRKELPGATVAANASQLK